MHNHPHLHDAHATAIDLMATAGDDPYKKATLKLLIEILDTLKAHDTRITEVEDGFANNDPPGHRKVHERDIAAAKAWRLDIRKIALAGVLAALGAIGSWLIPLMWAALRASLIASGNAQ